MRTPSPNVLRKMNHSVKHEVVGEYLADLLIGNTVIVELKAAESITKEHEAQLLNYLRATEIEVGLLLNFGKKPEFKRRAFSHSHKRSASVKHNLFLQRTLSQE